MSGTLVAIATIKVYDKDFYGYIESNLEDSEFYSEIVLKTKDYIVYNIYKKGKSK